MHSNFITPPDYVESVLIHDATEEQIQQLGDAVGKANMPYNVYFYNKSMNSPDWLEKIEKIADKIIYAENTDPIEYFTK
jgi:hypothetical protein